MPRVARRALPDLVYHVLNRGNNRQTVFRKGTDYRVFSDLVARLPEKFPVRILAYCLMPNHYHLVIWPLEAGALSQSMHWLITSHLQRYQRHYEMTGHLWTGRFRSFPVQQDGHLVTVLRYVERNPLRAGLVRRAEDWPWSSIRLRTQNGPPSLLAPSPVQLPEDWTGFVNQLQTDTEIAKLRGRLRRNAPFGDDGWTRVTAERLGCTSRLRPIGRPKGPSDSVPSAGDRSMDGPRQGDR